MEESTQSNDDTDAKCRSFGTIVLLIAVTIEQLLETSGWRGDHRSDLYRHFHEHNGK